MKRGYPHLSERGVGEISTPRVHFILDTDRVNPHAIGYDGNFAKLMGKPCHSFSFFQFGF
jgi:hypothetical protein